MKRRAPPAPASPRCSLCRSWSKASFGASCRRMTARHAASPWRSARYSICSGISCRCQFSRRYGGKRRPKDAARTRIEAAAVRISESRSGSGAAALLVFLARSAGTGVVAARLRPEHHGLALHGQLLREKPRALGIAAKQGFFLVGQFLAVAVEMGDESHRCRWNRPPDPPRSRQCRGRANPIGGPIRIVAARLKSVRWSVGQGVIEIVESPSRRRCSANASGPRPSAASFRGRDRGRSTRRKRALSCAWRGRGRFLGHAAGFSRFRASCNHLDFLNPDFSPTIISPWRNPRSPVRHRAIAGAAQRPLGSGSAGGSGAGGGATAASEAGLASAAGSSGFSVSALSLAFAAGTGP